MLIPAFAPKRHSGRITARQFRLLTMVLALGCGTNNHQPVIGEGAASAASQTPVGNADHQNRLAQETSPYLLMHAHNPVDWYPWGEEALNKAKRENRVIFLSIGYSSCHWCHVMEKESFMDEEIARFLNQHFVCIKLDREERPDVDLVYLSAVQIISRGGGGWPLSVFMTPDAKPFFGGTYFPARDGDRPGQSGFLSVIQRVQQAWKEQPKDIIRSADQLSELVATQLRGQPAPTPVTIDEKLVRRVQSALADRFDEEYGGFGYDPANPRLPKFPEPSNLLFLIDRLQRHDDAQARRMLEKTLERMAMGGIRDHLGGGFHRYSVDRFWKIPHFEKMLYDNGQLASVYAEAYRLTGRDDFRRVLVEMVDFVMERMMAPEGAFFAALDADSEGDEGKFYRWESAELKRVLGTEMLEDLGSVYGLEGEPNFEGSYYVPMLHRPLAEVAAGRSITETQLEQRLLPLRQALLTRRNQRTRPHTDTKILTSWNGLMIRGLADAGRVLDDRRYVDSAARAATFLLANLRTADGRLLRTYTAGRAKLNAYLDDYAFLVDGLIALHRSTGQDPWLQAATELTDKQIELFWDERDGGFFFTSSGHESLIARGKASSDGARPSGNSVAAENLLYLAGTVPKPEYADYANKTIQSASLLLQRAPTAVPRLAVAISRLVDAGAHDARPVPSH